MRQRGTLAHFGGGEGIHPDDVERDDMPPRKRPPRGFGQDTGVGAGRAGPSDDDSAEGWRRGLAGQGTGGYGGQYAGLAAGLRGRGSRLRPDPAEMMGAYGERGGSDRGDRPERFISNDDRLRQRVRARLARDRDLSAGGIDVSVRDGEVMLEGTVMTARARREAGELATLSGARYVVNRLHIRGERDR
jgi:hypothetical protein